MDAKTINKKNNVPIILRLLILVLCTLLLVFISGNNTLAQWEIDTSYTYDFYKGDLKIDVTAAGDWDDLEVQCKETDNDITKFQTSHDIWKPDGFATHDGKTYVKLKRNTPTNEQESIHLYYWGDDKASRGGEGRIFTTLNGVQQSPLYSEPSMCLITDFPTLNEWGIIIFITVIIGISVVMLRKRRPA